MSTRRWDVRAVTTGENARPWDGPHACAFVQGSFEDVLGDRGVILKYHQSQSSRHRAVLPRRGPNKKSQLCLHTSLLPPLSPIVPSWKCFHIRSSLTPIYPSDLPFRDYISYPEPTRSAHPPSCFSPYLCFGRKHCLLIPVFATRLWGSRGLGPVPSHLFSAAPVLGDCQWELWAKEGRLQGQFPLLTSLLTLPMLAFLCSQTWVLSSPLSLNIFTFSTLRKNLYHESMNCWYMCMCAHTYRGMLAQRASVHPLTLANNNKITRLPQWLQS